MRRNRDKKPSIFTKKNMIGLLTILIMVSSSIGYMVIEGDSADGADTYNGRKITQQDNFFFIEHAGEQIKLRFHPGVSESIDFPAEAVSGINSSVAVLLSMEPGDKNIQYVEQIRLELEDEMSRVFDKYTITGVSENNGSYSEFVQLSCLNATKDVPVVVFKSGAEEAFHYSGYCLTATASTGNDLLMMKDRFILGLAGVIN